ncbi:MAG: mannitol dehydrogenase family protein [Proteobacteria bacterium]|nr:mannitol dehydrogenase family protein [Pseudomonadota bacterium]HQR02549.1 mannitol dehydrogenase family protein [Rhodocyclaceae bacterium]
MRLTNTTLANLRAGIDRPQYDREAQDVGIIHLGIGAFHRAHQAWYTDRAMDAGDRHWAITGISLRSADVAGQLNPQNGLYTLTESGGSGIRTRLIGAVREVVAAMHNHDAAITRLAAPTTRIVSLTITEKGYCRAADGSLDLGQAEKGSIYPLMASGLRRRRDAGLPGLTLLSCDNLSGNGHQLARFMGEYIDCHDPTLTQWFEAECACPSTMVDRIVPATTREDRAAIAMRIGLDDAAAVMTERFSQWVIEDRFVGHHPRWESVGATLVSDVTPYETAKLRMLNGAHSALAYIGLACGHTFVHEAIADPVIRALIERLLLEEAAPTIAAAPGQNLPAYAAALIDRFGNPALNHRLIQIAMDGSQKIPQRWLPTLAANRSVGRECPAILSGIAAWVHHLQGRNGPVDDPQAAVLSAAARGTNPLDALFGAGGVLGSSWSPEESDRLTISRSDRLWGNAAGR